MRVFVTGATGFIGTLVVKELLGAGHQVVGLSRSESGAKALAKAGAEVRRGFLEDLNGLRDGASDSDGVIHLAFNHDFSTFVANCQADRKIVEALGSGLAGTNRPFVVTSGTVLANIVPGQASREDNQIVSASTVPRAVTEEAAASVAASGVSVSVVRLPQVHDPVKQGLVTPAIELARQKGVSVYVGDGSNQWPAAHVTDVARLYRLALEKNESGAKYHAVAEEGVPFRDIAEEVGRGLKIPVKSLTPEEAAAHFGWLNMFASHDFPASSAQTRERLGWKPTGPGLLADLAAMDFSVS